MKRKAVSELVGSMMVLLLIFIFSIALFTISFQQFQFQQARISKESFILEKLFRQNFIIEHVHKQSSNVIRILIRNLGEENITITQIIISNSTFTRLFDGLMINIPSNSLYTYDANIGTNIKSNSEYKISVISEVFYGEQLTGRKNIVAINWVAP